MTDEEFARKNDLTARPARIVSWGVKPAKVALLATGDVAVLIGVPPGKLSMAASVGAFSPVPPIIGRQRIWGPEHIRAAASYFISPRKPGRPRKRRELEGVTP